MLYGQRHDAAVTFRSPKSNCFNFAYRVHHIISTKFQQQFFFCFFLCVDRRALRDAAKTATTTVIQFCRKVITAEAVLAYCHCLIILIIQMKWMS